MEVAVFQKMKETLEQELPIRSIPPQSLNRELLKGYGLVTDRPLLVALNQSEQEAAKPMPAGVQSTLETQQAAGMVLSASVEAAIAAMEPTGQAAVRADPAVRQPRRS